MKFLDTSDNPRITRLMTLTQNLRSCQNPYEALLMYAGYLRDANPGRGHVVLSTAGFAPGEYRIWRILDDKGTEHIELRNPWTDLSPPIYSGGIFGKIIANKMPQVLHDVDWSADPYFAKVLAPYRSILAVPLFNEGLPLNWSMVLDRQSDFFTANHLEDSVMRATLVGSLLGSLHVSRELESANGRIEAELLRMARIQRALLPEPIPNIPGLQLAASYETFAQVGGDLYDFIPLGGEADPWCIFIGDASGHGPSAAVVAAMVQATLSDCAIHSAGPAHLFRTLNHRLCQKRIEGSFVTAFLGYYEPKTGRLRYASAGHPEPVLASTSDRKTSFLDLIGGLPLGIDTDASFDESTIDLHSGQTLLLYTDGITDARSPDGAMFGPEGIERSIVSSSEDATGVIDGLRKSLATHQQGRRPNDDQTAVAIRVQQ